MTGRFFVLKNMVNKKNTTKLWRIGRRSKTWLTYNVAASAKIMPHVLRKVYIIWEADGRMCHDLRFEHIENILYPVNFANVIL